VTSTLNSIAEASDTDASARSFSLRRGELCAAATLLVVGLCFVWQASFLKFGDLEQPGPGFFPLVLGAALAGLSAAIGINVLRRRLDGQTVALGHRDVLLTMAALVAIPILFERLGTYATLGLFMAALLILIGRVSPVRAAAAAAVAMIAVWAFFKILLGLQLPAGPF
jgi:hypothetical protein